MSVRVVALTAILLAVALSGCLRDLGQSVGLSPDDPDPWVQPELSEATIQPGVALTYQGSVVCTTNFLFLDANKADVYLGTAAHCFADGPSTQTNGCSSEIDPYEPGRVALDVQGGRELGVLAYSSWWSMQQNGASDEACASNDFALVKLHPEDAARAHPSLLGFGGPTMIATDVSPLDIAYSYGQSNTLPRPEEFDPRRGVVTHAETWEHNILFDTPGLPGDSGSAVIRSDGAAIGVLVTVGTTPGEGKVGNGVVNLQQALEFARQQGMDVELLTAPLLETFPNGN